MAVTDPSSRRIHREHFEEFAEAECGALPLYAALSHLLATSEAAAQILDHAAAGQRRPVLLLAAIHDRLLEIHPTGSDAASDLGAWYPTIVPQARPVDDDTAGALAGAVTDFLEDHRGSLTDLVASRSTNTNEPNRSAAWILGLAAATADLPDTPVVWVELGASAGLNLAFDRYALDSGGPVLGGDVGSAVVIRTEFRGDGTPPRGATPPPVAVRWGVDLDPVDVDDERELRWLRACLWPEQTARLARFDAAVAMHRTTGHRVEAGDAIDSVAGLADRVPSGHHLVVAHSWMLTYVARPRRRELDAELSAIARNGPVTWLSVEAPGVVDALPHDGDGRRRFEIAGHWSLLGMTRFRSGRRDDSVLARCHPHLTWVEWRETPDRAIG